MRRQHVIVAGNGMVGQKFVDALVAADTAQEWAITVVGEEPRPAYDRVALSSWFDGTDESELRLVPDELLGSGRVDYRFGVAVTSIDLESRKVVLGDGCTVGYDELVLATGSSPFVPPIPGHDLPGCFVYRTLDDLDAIRAWATVETAGRPRRTGVVIGGGLLGLEAANALRNLGLDTHVVEMAPHLMPQQLDAAGGAMLERWIAEIGVTIHCGVSTQAIAAAPGGNGVDCLQIEGRGPLPADIVVFSAGIRPRDQLARDCGLDTGARGGVVVDDLLRCQRDGMAVDGLSAIGEVACHDGMAYGLVAPGYEMARSVAARLTGGDAEGMRFRGADLSAKLKLLGVDVASFGDAKATEGVEEIVFSDPIGKIHRRLVVDRESGRLRGGLLVGDASGYDLLRLMALGDMPTPTGIAAHAVPESLSAATAAGGELPDSAQVCTCNAVSKGDLCAAIAAGCHSVGALKSETTAGTGCAGCVPAVTSLLKTELTRLGVEVSDRLCEHFDHSRQELFDLVRFHRYSTWREVLDNHGTGRGCEICRPAVASILASLSNGYILDGDQSGLQDTNDHVLANMQRNGTYSVVPRVPGGEITPDQLIALGEIAKDFGLYTKITGAQRVDLFGARISELPAIWQRVVDAGLESGHAYGKALRTVKSCVGSTWCRYGVQDSVSMAIRLELRYRGLRSPHKLKSAVSGCTRECAEAQSKDFGVIATEKGWNLYVGGNGGKTPRHADLFATDLDDETLIRYIDRFLMFYIRTADRLERTAPWLEKLEGGLDHLREVIVDDSLGICDELDADMARHVESYECEWTATLREPERLEHFVEFVNAPDDVSTPEWIVERGQRAPAPAVPVTLSLPPTGAQNGRVSRPQLVPVEVRT